MASIEKRIGRRRDASGRIREVTRYRVRYRDAQGRSHSETAARRADAERRRCEIEHELAASIWHDPHRGDVPLADWVELWLPTRHDLRATTKVRLEVTMNRQVLPRFGRTRLRDIRNADIRTWVVDMMDTGLPAATARKAVFALRQALEAVIADQRLIHNAAAKRPIPTKRAKPPRLLSQAEVERLVDQVPERDRAPVLVGAYAGLRHSFVAIMVAAGCKVREVSEWAGHNSVAFTLTRYGGLFDDCTDDAIDRRDALLGPAWSSTIPPTTMQDQLRTSNRW